jgi:hypothetical protein
MFGRGKREESRMNDITKSRLTVFELLGFTIRFFFERFKPLLGVYCLVFLPQSLLFTYLGLKTNNFHDVAPSSIGYVLAISFLLIPINVLALTPLAYQYALKRKTDLYAVVDGLFTRYLKVFVSFLAVMAIISGLCVLLIVPGIIGAVYLSFALNLPAWDGSGVKDSIRNSYRMVKGNWWHVFGVMLAAFVIYFMLALSLNVFLALFFRGNILAVLNGIGNYCLSMFYNAVACILFANLHMIGKDRLVNIGK